jgi:hypothetical protein
MTWTPATSALGAAALLLLAACGSAGDRGGGEPEASPFSFEPQTTCDRNFAVTPADVTVFGARAGDYLADRFSLATGDFNDDGFDDVLVGAPLADGPDHTRENAGAAYIIFGAAKPPAQVDLAEGVAVAIIGTAASDNLGFTVAAGDVDGDGRDDAIIGARFADTGEAQDAGKAYVIYGTPDLEGRFDTAAGDQDLTINGETTGGFLAYSLATGDIDGDGILDLLMGASGADGPEGNRPDAGEVRAFLGSPDLPAEINAGEAFFTAYGGTSSDSLPNDLAAGDADGDGKDEIIVGAPFVDAELREDAGRVYVIPVPKDGGVLDLSQPGARSLMTGGARKDGLGFQVAAADVDGDGVDDVIAGARDADGPEDAINNAGEVHVWLGRDDLPRSTDLKEATSDSVIVGSTAGDSLGFTVAAEDLDGDRIADILAGAALADGCGNTVPEAGDAYVVFGRSPLPPVFFLKDRGDLTFLGGGAGDGLGFSVASGDFNGDGTMDVVLGALQADGPDDQRLDAGEAYIVLGDGQ